MDNKGHHLEVRGAIHRLDLRMVDLTLTSQKLRQSLKILSGMLWGARPPDLTAAAEHLGITEETLTEEALREALGLDQ